MTLVETLRNYPGDDNEFYEELGQKIYERLLEKTAWKSIRFSFREETTDVTCSKLGGIPFIPANGEYPVDGFTKEKLFFLFQINFAEMPHLDPYPSNGILQIFISGEELYGMDMFAKCSQKSWRMLYHEDISNPLSKEEAAKLMPEINENLQVPILNSAKEYAISFIEENIPISTSDYRFCSKVAEVCADFLPDELKETSDIYDYPRPLRHYFWGVLDNSASRLGGYPDFIQDDYRKYERLNQDRRELLLQLSTEKIDDEYIMMWEDGGNGYFFIAPEDLSKRDFTNVYYEWDCC